MAYNFRKFGKIQEKLMYRDTCTVTGTKEVTDEYGGTILKPDTEKYKDIKCKFSFKGVDNPSDSTVANVPVLRVVSLHCSLDYDIKAGDFISGIRKDDESGIEDVVEGYCNEPNRYTSHQEILLSEEKVA